jgi:hypothetical protein
MKGSQMKVQYVLAALQAGKNKFTVAQLTDVIRADAGDKALARRTRRALFVARKAGIILEPLRDGGKAVVAYQLSGSVPATATVATTTRKAAKAASPKVAAKAKAPKIRVTKQMQKSVAAKIESEDKAAIRAKNLATIKAVHAKTKQHPITGRELTDDQADVLDEFRALESAWESEEQDRAFARAAVRENLKKEAYVE